MIEMGFCRSRYFMLVICFLQFIAVIERQVFDFLGYLYIPILLNFFQIIFIIFGSFGAFQYRPKYIITYVLWNLIWLGWNIFLICLYLDVGILDHKANMVLKLDRESGSWWMNGPGCKQTLNGDDNVHVDGCLLEYEHIEIFQGALQSVLAFLGIISGLCLSKIFLEEDDSFNYMGGGNDPQHTSIQPMYVDTDAYLCSSSSSPFTHTNNLTTNNRTSLPTQRNSDQCVVVGKVGASCEGDVLLLGDKYLLYDTDSAKKRHTAKVTDIDSKTLSQSYMSFFKNEQ